MEGKDRSLLVIVARTGVLAFIAVFVVLIPMVSSTVVFPETDLPLALEYYNFARKLFFASLAVSGINIIYLLSLLKIKA